jgi:hypothetical protein
MTEASTTGPCSWWLILAKYLLPHYKNIGFDFIDFVALICPDKFLVL